MTIEKLEIPDILLIRPRVFDDDRGYFYESFNSHQFIDEGIPSDFKQDNHSSSKKNVIRGLHFQKPPFEQGKLVRVVRGAALDVVVDIRSGSDHYGKYLSVELNDRNKHLLWIPPGFAHGFRALEDDTIFLYKCTKEYNRESESGILWNDSEIGIDWGTNDPIVSDKDQQLGRLSELEQLF